MWPFQGLKNDLTVKFHQKKNVNRMSLNLSNELNLFTTRYGTIMRLWLEYFKTVIDMISHITLFFSFLKFSDVYMYALKKVCMTTTRHRVCALSHCHESQEKWGENWEQCQGAAKFWFEIRILFFLRARRGQVTEFIK